MASRVVLLSSLSGAVVALVAAEAFRRLRSRRARSADFEKTQPPHPEWKVGLPQPLPFAGGMVTLDPKKLGSCYSLMISAYVPRPIAFVSTMSASGIGNVAPFSYSGLFAHDPPMIGVSLCNKSNSPDGKKDTLANIDETSEFVICIMSEWFAEAANHTCGNFARSVDEFDEAGLTRAPSVLVKPPRVAESAVHFECVLRHRHEIVNKDGVVTATFVLGEVVMIHVAEAILDMDGAGAGKPVVVFDKFRPLARLGGLSYGLITSTFDLPR